MRRIVGIVLAVLLIGGVAVAVVAGRDSKDTSTATKTVRGVIGSEKAEFFADPDVVKALAAKGFTVKAETSGSWAMERLPLKGYDFAFPGSKAPADELQRKSPVKGGPLRPFYSPLVVVAHRGAAQVLADNGLATLSGRAALRADVLFPVRQKHQDLLTQLAVCAQGYLAMDVVRRNNEELIRGVDRAATTTVSALRIAVMLASALESQRKVTEQVQVLRSTTEDLIRGNAEMLATQSGEIQRIAADPAVGAETLRTAFQQIYRTLDAIDMYKVQATESMAATVESLTSELQQAGTHLERSRSAGALEGGGPG
ncbi:toxic anion resistance protein [Streptomyces atratus]|uniref:toxic anion resistance protein n=1 Tax=Streptomyces atratus TaxID=1893 RepID=UPI0033CEEEF8